MSVIPDIVVSYEMSVMFKGYRKLLENADDMKEQSNSTEAIQRFPTVYDELMMLSTTNGKSLYMIFLNN